VVPGDALTGVAETGDDAGGVVDGDAGSVAAGEDGPVAGHDPAIVMVWSCETVKGGELESMTVAEKAKVPVAVGVPEIAPDDARVSPGGRGPDADQAKGGVPPSTVGRLAV